MAVREINIIGMGVMGSQIAALFIAMGYRVNAVARKTPDPKKFEFSCKVLQKSFSIDTNLVGQLKMCSNIGDISDVITIEAVSEDLKSKRETYKKVRSVSAKPFLSNTSSLTPHEIAEDVLGVHFFNPIQIGVVELCFGADQSYEHDLQNMIIDLKNLNFEIIEVHQNRGYLGNYLLFNEISTVFKLIEVFGYDINSIQQIYKSLYPNRNIFTIIDIIGIDVTLRILKNLNSDDKGIYIPKALEQAVANGIHGRKNKTSLVAMLEEESIK